MMKDDVLLVVSAHTADWIWRSSGTIAKYLEAGAKAYVICLTYGVRGESNPLWKVEGQTAQGVRDARTTECQNAAAAIGLPAENLIMLDFNDFPLLCEPEILQALQIEIRKIRPTLILTHDEEDSTNYDHGSCHEIVKLALKMATSAGIESDGLKPCKNVPIYGFEASEAERSGYIPQIYINITSVWDKKLAAMKCVTSQVEGPNIHTRLSTHRGWQGARTVTGINGMEYGESFKMFFPLCVEELPSTVTK